MLHCSKYEEYILFISFKKEKSDRTLNIFIFLRESAVDFLLKVHKMIEHSHTHVVIVAESATLTDHFL